MVKSVLGDHTGLTIRQMAQELGHHIIEPRSLAKEHGLTLKGARARADRGWYCHSRQVTI